MLRAPYRGQTHRHDESAPLDYLQRSQSGPKLFVSSRGIFLYVMTNLAKIWYSYLMFPVSYWGLRARLASPRPWFTATGFSPIAVPVLKNPTMFSTCFVAANWTAIWHFLNRLRISEFIPVSAPGVRCRQHCLKIICRMHTTLYFMHNMRLSRLC